MQAGSKHGKHIFSPLNPPQGCPQANTLSQDNCIKFIHSYFLQTSLNAGFILGEGYFKASKQNLHSFKFF
jgi:hypothetical protein